MGFFWRGVGLPPGTENIIEMVWSSFLLSRSETGNMMNNDFFALFLSVLLFLSMGGKKGRTTTSFFGGGGKGKPVAYRRRLVSYQTVKERKSNRPDRGMDFFDWSSCGAMIRQTL
jgi:hypothetical protein